MSITLNCAPINPNASYRVTVNSFLAAGGDNFVTLAQGTQRAELGVTDLAALIAYFEENSPITADTAPVERPRPPRRRAAPRRQASLVVRTRVSQSTPVKRAVLAVERGPCWSLAESSPASPLSGCGAAGWPPDLVPATAIPAAGRRCRDRRARFARRRGRDPDDARFSRVGRFGR